MRFDPPLSALERILFAAAVTLGDIAAFLYGAMYNLRARRLQGAP